MGKADPLRRAALAAALILIVNVDASAEVCAPDTIELRTNAGNHAFTIELADDPAEQVRGLMFRPSMAADHGMLFVYDPPQRASFWMRNTMIPLDMVFIDDTGRVESIAVRQDTYSTKASSSEGSVRGVLEINAGLSEELGIVPGSQAVHPAFTQAPEGARCPD